ncbi:hypothetical protein BC829DRAFT_406302 [Chytridium lagenaria]|nr:hypothetical protein BC829DRAFT_406302 [Chytridium lagenaria]
MTYRECSMRMAIETIRIRGIFYLFYEVFCYNKVVYRYLNAQYFSQFLFRRPLCFYALQTTPILKVFYLYYLLR